MDDMDASSVVAMEDRRRRISRAVAARRRLDRAPFPRSEQRSSERKAGGRAWVNGIEVGGTDPRHTPLALSHD